jgi:hypothetical protein
LGSRALITASAAVMQALIALRFFRSLTTMSIHSKKTASFAGSRV